ncbi:MAG TPA: hypothetical protein VFE19_12515 [Jatrophihabitantaceae bacterium]|nr:hypothetical protein [Jatrophihabitantaceae bacterium]
MRALLIFLAGTGCACAVAVPAVIGLSGNPSFSQRIPVRAPAAAHFVTFDPSGRAVEAPEVADSSPSRTRSEPSRTPTERSREPEHSSTPERSAAPRPTPTPSDRHRGRQRGGDDD